MFPAPAGINRRRAWACLCLPGVPRASGDKPKKPHASACLIWCSPRQRG
ncbi:hypothetical protein CIT292_09830 [Citrobacter youngae ATCC 29220]|uniref:Uncharacterized protein n=1 Tax=Citrobacter youngae ATCC 29220 TaxID=500640 RepID=D4BH23_9ENTR|nr:hypothetical protein CIT292_09830 [Citrobacter youngae ATCC 29220]